MIYGRTVDGWTRDGWIDGLIDGRWVDLWTNRINKLKPKFTYTYICSSLGSILQKPSGSLVMRFLTSSLRH